MESWDNGQKAPLLQYFVHRLPDVDIVRTVVQKEVCGPGQLLGYRAMNQKLRCEHGIKVPRNLVFNVMVEIDPEGLAQRSMIKKRKRRANLFRTDDPLYVVSLDKHDKRVSELDISFRTLRMY